MEETTIGHNYFYAPFIEDHVGGSGKAGTVTLDGYETQITANGEWSVAYDYATGARPLGLTNGGQIDLPILAEGGGPLRHYRIQGHIFAAEGGSWTLTADGETLATGDLPGTESEYLDIRADSSSMAEWSGGELVLELETDFSGGKVGYLDLRADYSEDGPESLEDNLGVFNGTIPSREIDGETVYFQWTGDEFASPTRAYTQVESEDPDPEDPDPEDPAWKINAAKRIARYLDAAGDDEVEALALEHVEVIAAYVYGYTRGRGFTSTGKPKPDVAHVMTAATARLTANPSQVTSYSVGDYSERPALLTGWTLLERDVLNRYRRRWA